MGDMGDVFRAMRQAGQERRSDKRDRGLQVIREACRAGGHRLDIKNDGAHFIIHRCDGHEMNYWPGTGRRQPRVVGAKTKRGGVAPALKWLRRGEQSESKNREGEE